MNCSRCGYELLWQSDFDASDLDCEVEGVVSYYSCKNCGVEVEIFYPNNNEKGEM